MLSAEGIRNFSIAMLIGIPLVLAAAAWLALRRTEMTFLHACLYAVDHFLARLLWRTKIRGRMPLRPGQGAVIICNHTSSVDPAFLQLLIPKAVHWMVAREYVASKSLGWLLRGMGTIPVNRGGTDTAATKLAIRYAQAGELIGMFPEGRINRTSELLLPGRPGAALIALRARVPVIPCYIEGAPAAESIVGPLLRSARVTLYIGEAIDLSPYYGREKEDGVTEALTLIFLKEIAKLAGRPDFQPRLAGRRWRTDADAEQVEPEKEAVA